ncbi:MAG TPA: protein-L-isoaspartate(D-aspartate) O-methyltransferase [Thermoanaerobaculia bacterium]|nr:protein-L-isoaspartate(D-aspartate) O-methyltransferase [Thermoanaerobaculia bacterium]
MSVADARFRYARENLVRLLQRRGIRDERVLEAMRRVPRHRFVPDHLQKQAYDDFALPIGADQTISQPFVVATMTEELQVRPSDSVLEIGTGSGYQTAILAHLARVVYSIERIGALAQEAIRRMRELELTNVKIQVFDGTVGYSEAAPYDRILVTAGAPSVPGRLLEQLGSPGRMVIPEGDRAEQRLVIYEKDRLGKLERWLGAAVAFVPLIGRDGWPEGSRR